MGDINFNIAKDVNLNKTVNLNIDKNVDVNVNIDDLLATAEADAEAFGTFALAEVDAYTFVNEGGDSEPRPPIFSSGQLEILGNTEPFDAGVDPGDDISISFDPADLDDINGLDHFAPLDGVPQGPDFPIPDPLLTISDLTLTDGELINPDVPNEYNYLSANDFVVDYGERYVERNNIEGEQDGERGFLTFTIQAGTTYEVGFNGGIVVEAEVTEGRDPDAFFTFTPTTFDVVESNNEEVQWFTEFRADAEFASLGQIGSYETDGITDQINWHPVPPPVGPGEAFAYAESTSAVDLM